MISSMLNSLLLETYWRLSERDCSVIISSGVQVVLSTVFCKSKVDVLSSICKSKVDRVGLISRTSE